MAEDENGIIYYKNLKNCALKWNEHVGRMLEERGLKTIY